MARQLKVTKVKITGKKEIELVEVLSDQFDKEVKLFENGAWKLEEIKGSNANYGKLKTYYFKFPNSKNREHKRQGIHSFIKSVAIRSGVFLIADSDIKKKPHYKNLKTMTAYYKKNAPLKCSEVLIISNFNPMIEKLAETLTKNLPVKVIDISPKKQLIFNIKKTKEEQANVYYETPEEKERLAKFCKQRVREEQPKFREKILKKYNGTCVVTGCNILAILDAAHILSVEYGGDYKPNNGLLLRADLHRLFDRGLMAIDPDTGKVHFKDTGEHYNKYDQKIVDIPKSSRENLIAHWQKYNE